MKQKLTLGLAAVTTALGVGALAIPLSPNGFAEAPDCSAVTDQTKLTTCIEANENITLGGDVELSSVVTIKGGYDAKINLNNHTITRNANSAAFQIRQGRLILEGNGTVERFGINSANSRPTIRIYGSTEAQTSSYSSLVVGENVILKNNDDAAIGIDANETGAFHGIEVLFKGEAYARYGISVAKDVNSYNGMPTIEVADGAIINAETGIETSAPGQAIRAEGPAKWNIGKASIIGDTGIALRAGEFHLNGPTVIATGPDEAPVHEFALDKSGDKYCGHGIGAEFCEKFLGTGSAIQIQEEQTESEDGINGIEIFIDGGIYQSKYGYAFSEYKEQAEKSDPKILTDTLKTFRITNGDLKAFTDIDDTQKEALKNDTRYTLGMVTDDFFWRYGDGRMCADGSASIKSYDEDWLRTNFIVREFNEGEIGGLAKIYEDLSWIERLLIDYTSFPGPYGPRDFTDMEKDALDEYAISKGISSYEDIKMPLLFQLDLLRFEKDDADFESIEGEEGYFRGSLTTPGAFSNASVDGSHSFYPSGKDNPLTGGTSKPYTVIHDTEDYPLTFTMKLPENLPAVEDGYTRTYSILDLHCISGSTEEESEICEVFELPVTMSEDNTEYTFTTTKFSDFILTYNDTNKTIPEPTPEPEPSTSVPDTGYAKQGILNSSSDQAIIITIATFLILAGALIVKKIHN